MNAVIKDLTDELEQEMFPEDDGYYSGDNEEEEAEQELASECDTLEEAQELEETIQFIMRCIKRK